MGFFDAIKNAKNAITGGAATVQLQVGPVTRGQPAMVQVNAMAKGSINFNSVYLLIRCIEKAEVTEIEYEDGKWEKDKEKGQVKVFDTRVDIAGPAQMAEGQQASWQGQIMIPQQTNPTLHGKTIHNVWQIQAGLDATGNDPDSGWIEFQVY